MFDNTAAARTIGEMSQIFLLGPQRENPTVATAVRLAGVSGPMAVVSAGWQEREGELDDLRAHLGDAELIDLRLYERTEQVFHDDPQLFEAWRSRQDWLRELQRIYAIRLRHALRATRELCNREGIEPLIERERDQALHAVRELDRHHMREIRRLHFEHWRQWQPARRPAVAQHRAELAAVLERCGTLLVAGGHIAVLLNRLRLYDLGPLISDKTLIGWSAGAMALAQRIFLFHDLSPQGAGNAEVFDAGLGAYRGVIAFPDAASRLDLADPDHISLLAGRLLPARGVTLDEASVLAYDGRHWHAHGATGVLRESGMVEQVDA